MFIPLIADRIIQRSGTQRPWISSESRPISDLVEQRLPGALGRRALSVPDQTVRWPQMAERHTASDKLLGGLSRRLCRQSAGKHPDHGDAGRLVVVAGRVCTLTAPAATLVHRAIASDQEIVADIRPAVSVHVQCLEAAYGRRASGLCGARRGRCVMDDDKRGWSYRQRAAGVTRGQRLPSGSCDDSRTSCESERKCLF